MHFLKIQLLNEFVQMMNITSLDTEGKEYVSYALNFHLFFFLNNFFSNYICILIIIVNTNFPNQYFLKYRKKEY